TCIQIPCFNFGGIFKQSILHCFQFLLSTWYQSNICHYYTFFMSDMFGSYIPNFMTTFLIPPATINCMITFPNHCPAIAYGTCSQSTNPSPKGPIPTRTNTLESRNPDTIP